MKKLFLSILCLILIVSCKVQSEVTVKVSDIVAKKQMELPVKIGVDLLTCKDSDTGMDSQYLLEAKQKIPYIFEGATYSGCKGAGFGDLAVFNYSLKVYPTLQKAPGVSFNYNGGALFMNISPEVESRIKKIKRGSIATPDMEFAIKLKNDTQKKVEFLINGVYYNGKPYQFSKQALSPGQTSTIIPFQGTIESALTFGSIVIVQLRS